MPEPTKYFGKNKKKERRQIEGRAVTLRMRIPLFFKCYKRRKVLKSVGMTSPKPAISKPLCVDNLKRSFRQRWSNPVAIQSHLCSACLFHQTISDSSRCCRRHLEICSLPRLPLQWRPNSSWTKMIEQFDSVWIRSSVSSCAARALLRPDFQVNPDR